MVAHFRFKTIWERRSAPLVKEEGIHVGHAYGPFPKALGHVLDDIGVTEMRLSFSRGEWDHQAYGSAPDASASGVELWARVPRDEGTAAAAAAAAAGSGGGGDRDLRRWRRLRGALAGLFCASLDLMGEAHTVEPTFSLHTPTSVAGADPTTQLLYGVLPRDAVCGENLTPWAKLLPCRRRTGLAALVDSVGMFSADHHSMSLHFVAGGATRAVGTTTWSLVQSLTAVLHPPAGLPKPPVPSPFEADRNDANSPPVEWALSTLFDEGERGSVESATDPGSLAARHPTALPAPPKKGAVACPVADASRVTVALPDWLLGDGAGYGGGDDDGDDDDNQRGRALVSAMSLDPAPSAVSCSRSTGRKACEAAYHLETRQGEPLDIHMNFTPRPTTVNTAGYQESGSPLRILRFQTGYGQHRGGLVTKLINTNRPGPGAPGQDGSVRATLLDPIPSFLRVFAHTLEVTLTVPKRPVVNASNEGGAGAAYETTVVASGWGGPMRPVASTVAASKAAGGVVRRIVFTPGEDRSTPNLFEIEAVVPAQATLAVAVQFEKAFLGIEEFPPDPARGFDLPPSVATILPPDEGGQSEDGDDDGGGGSGGGETGSSGGVPVSARLYSEGLLVMMPEPDFSMPYNVITLTSTVIAFFFGTMLNILVRRPKKKEKKKQQGTDGSKKKPGRCARVKQMCSRKEKSD